MLIQLFITVVFFFILMCVSVNLFGLLVRGFFSNPELDILKQTGDELIKKEIEKSQRAGKLLNIIALILIMGYLYLLFYFWNIGVMSVAVIIMAGRLPDLLWDIKHGKKTDLKSMKKNALYYIISLLPWIGLPVLYYSLYYLPK